MEAAQKDVKQLEQDEAAAASAISTAQLAWSPNPDDEVNRHDCLEKQLRSLWMELNAVTNEIRSLPMKHRREIWTDPEEESRLLETKARLNDETQALKRELDEITATWAARRAPLREAETMLAVITTKLRQSKATLQAAIRGLNSANQTLVSLQAKLPPDFRNLLVDASSRTSGGPQSDTSNCNRLTI